MKKLPALWMALVAALALSACGGGGSDSGDDGGNGGGGGGGGTTLSITPSQDGAAALVQAVNDGVGDIRAADAAGALPGGAFSLALPSAATGSGSIDCSMYGGTGSISYSYSFNDTTYAPTSYTYTYNNCTFNYGGYASSYNGSGSMTYEYYNNETSYKFTLVYDIQYSYSSNGYSDSGTIDSTEVCISDSVTGLSCSYLFGGNAISDFEVSTSGSTTTVSSATLTSDTVTCTYSDWVFDASTGRATSGTVTVSDGNGNSATITATGSGYTVSITVSGSTTTYTVGY